MHTGNILIYQNTQGNVNIDVHLYEGTVWLTQGQMQVLFQKSKPTISEHIKSIFQEGELDPNSGVRKFRTPASDGKTYLTKYYNLDVVLGVGYRVKSYQGTQFRIWATKTLKEYTIKGFILDDERLKQGNKLFGKDYFKELLERVRSIRASERRIYQQITDIFAECSIDYNPKSPITRKFYASVQKKFHFAITGKTAAELIYTKADSKKQNMGLTTWKNAPKGRILKSDTSIAKNYLNEKEIKQLERTVTAYFDYIETLIENKQTLTMEKLALSVNKFLSFNEYKILEGLGKVSHNQAEKKAYQVYDKFNKTQKITSDFDDVIKQLKKVPMQKKIDK